MSAILIARIAPEGLAEDALIAGLLEPRSVLDVLQRDAVFREKPAVRNVNFRVDAMREGQLAEKIAEEIVGLSIVLVLDFSLESVDFVQILTFVVAARHEKVLRVRNFCSQQRDDDFARERSSVDEVAVEQVNVLLWRLTVEIENIHEIIVLTVDISAYCDFFIIRDFNADHRFFFFENFSRFQDDHDHKFLV